MGGAGALGGIFKFMSMATAAGVKVIGSVVTLGGMAGAGAYAYYTRPDPLKAVDPTALVQPPFDAPLDNRELSLDELEKLPPFEGLVHASSFLDAHVEDWEMETNSFHNPPSVHEAAIRVWRNKHQYAGEVPALRIMGFLPRVTTDTVQKYLTNCELRLNWDPNYRQYDLLRPRAYDAKIDAKRKSPTDKPYSLSSVYKIGDQKVRACDYTITLSSKWVEKIGIKPRIFYYTNWQPGDANTLVESSKDTLEYAPGGNIPRMLLYRSRSLSEDLKNPKELLKSSIGDMLSNRIAEMQGTIVFMHWQQVTLVPIYNQTQLSIMLQRLNNCGATRSLPTLEELKAMTPNAPANEDPKGVFMVMTSLNDGKVARMPRWMEKQMGKFLGHLAQGALLDGIKKNKELIPEPKV